MHSDQSESDKDISPTKQRPHFLLSDNDLESYDDTSSRYDKEPPSGKSSMKTGISHKRMPSVPKIVPQKHKGIVSFTDM